MSRRRRPRWPWGIGLDKRQARRLRRRLAPSVPHDLSQVAYLQFASTTAAATPTKES